MSVTNFLHSPAMKLPFFALYLSCTASFLFAKPDCDCGADQCTPACTCEQTADEQPADAGHPLTGVVQSVMAERQALLVKHEEVPGVMKAMTMLLRVAPTVLQQVKAGDAITATLHRSDDGVWYLDDVKIIVKD